MKALLDKLARTPIILTCLVAIIFISLRFWTLRQALDGQFLDMIMTGPAAEARLAEMNEAQRQAHFWGTLINDTLYPIAYGGFLAGLAARLAPLRERFLVVLPVLLAVILDLCENTVQMLALSGTVDLLAAKTVLTPAKFGLILVAVLLVIGLAIRATLDRTARQPDD